MKWFKGNWISNKNLSIFGVVVIICSLAFSITIPETSKNKVDTKHVTKKWIFEKKITKLAKKAAKPVAKKQLAKATTSKPKRAEKLSNYNLIKKSLKQRPRIVAYVSAPKLRTNAHLSMDGWNNHHEQIESSVSPIGDDPVGASDFESKRIQEELAASGI